MKSLTSLKQFKFNYAQYEVVDSKGNKGLLKIDYKNKSFTIDSKDKAILPETEKELTEFAADLVKRKSGRNFAE